MDLHILGIRGIPARHGGFETFAEQLALYLAEKGHFITVYCQLGPGEKEFTDLWRGIRRVGLREGDGPSGTIRFDLRSAIMSSGSSRATILTLGYNTAVFSLIYKLRGIRNVMNMDGIEWKRKKWNRAQQLWLWANEWLGLHLSDVLIADHPEIKRHLSRNIDHRKICIIPYGAPPVLHAQQNFLDSLGLSSRKYFLIVARPEPENSIKEIVEAYISKPRAFRLVVVGRFHPEINEYHASVLETARESNILFTGTIYDSDSLRELRYHSAAYIHGHQVGGTNPSLIEALAAGNAVLAHDNLFNRWVAGSENRFFSTINELIGHLDALENDPLASSAMRESSRRRHESKFITEWILEAYENILLGLPISDSRWSEGEFRNDRSQIGVRLEAPTNQ